MARRPLLKRSKMKPPKRREQPLGAGVGDSFAVNRLRPQGAPTTDSAQLREIGWAEFGDLARSLAARIAESYKPDVVVGIAKGGVFVGAAISAALKAEFYPVRIEKRSRDARSTALLAASKTFPALRGKKLLIVDDVAASGQTLEKARTLGKKAGAKEIQAAVLTVKPGGAHPEWFALESNSLVVYAWDYELPTSGDGEETFGV